MIQAHKLRRPCRSRECHRVVEGSDRYRVLDGGFVLLGLLQISGGGLESDPLAAPDAPIHERDFDTRIRAGIIADQAVLKSLQLYVKNVCR